MSKKINICFTGDLPVSRPTLTARLVMDGRFNVMTYVGAETDVLIWGSRGTAKLRKARDLGVKALNYYEFCSEYKIPTQPPSEHDVTWQRLKYPHTIMKFDPANVAQTVIDASSDPANVVQAVIDASSDTNWYDYDNQKRVGLPTKGEQVELKYKGEWYISTWVDSYDTGECLLMFLVDNQNNKGVCGNFNEIRPIDWNKNAKKPVDLSWLENSGIDVEFGLFTGDESKWVLIGALSNGSDRNHERPRLNHWFSTHQVSHTAIPEGFDIEYIICVADVLDNEHGTVDQTKVSNDLSDHFDPDVDKLVAFRIKGLRNGYVWPWELSACTM